MRHTSILVASLVSVLGSACASDECAEDDAVCHAEEDSALFEQAYDEGQQPGKEDGTDCSGVRVPDRTGFGKRIALTFDDGPNPATTPRVIEILKAHNAPATFFINGRKLDVAGGRDLAAQIAADPDFILANHSQNHTNLAEQSATKVVDEIMRTDAGIRAAGETPRYFRFPFGSSTCSSMAAVRTRGYISTGWHIDSADWCYAAGGGYCKKSTFKYVPDEMRDSMTEYVMSQVRSTGGGVLLFHDIHASTANALDGLLTTLEQAGYTFVRLDDQAVFPRLHGAAPVAQKFIGDACTTSAQCAFTAAGAAGRCHPAGFCTISCEGSCPDLAGKAPTFCIADTASTVAAGICASKPAIQNAQCTALTGTSRRVADRFVGTSTSSPAQAEVCAPR
jgi:peptidoglycan/xylan/chitin deacetylase (PgdA/CDA1 family)